VSEEAVALRDRRIAYLESLGEKLRGRGFMIQIMEPRNSPPSLRVVNPGASALVETILAERATDGWWYWWSWAERIAVVEDAEAAAARIAHVLASAGV
jgi:hypothetical protein